MSSVQEALKAREKKKQESKKAQSHTAKIDSAVEAYKKRKQSNIKNATTDMAKRINAEIEAIKNVSDPSWGADSQRNMLDSTRENRVKVAKLQREVESYKSYMDEETYKSFASTLGALKNTYDSYLGVSEIRSKFETEDDYNNYQIGWLQDGAETNAETAAARKNKYQSNANRLAEIEKKMDELGWTWWGSDENDQRKALKAEREKLETENRQYERTQQATDSHYDTLQKKDFDEVSSKRDYTNASKDELLEHNAYEEHIYTILNQGGTIDENGNVFDAGGHIKYSSSELAKAIRNNSQDQFYGSLIQDKLGLFLSASEDEIAQAYSDLSSGAGDDTHTWEKLMQEGDTSGWKQLTPDEISTYYYYLNTEGQEKAYQYLEDMTTILTKRETEARAKAYDEAPLLEQIFNNIASIPMNVFGGAAAFVDDTVNIVQGKDINPYSKGHALQNDATAIRTNTANDINAATGNAALPWVGTTWGDVYQSIMSAGDSAVGVAVGGNAYGVLMGMGAASSEMKDLYEKGASTGQMIAGGLLAGAAEMVFEKFSIDQLVSKKNPKSIIVNFLKQGGIEASEEMATEIANTITNAIVMGSQSDWVDAETFVKSVLNAGLGGFISGGAMGGVYSAVQKLSNGQQVKEHGQSIIDQGGVYALKRLGLDMYSEKGGASGLRGTNLTDKVFDKASAKNVGKLAEHISNTISSQNRADIEAALIEKGLSKKDAKRAAEYLNKASQGYEFSEAEIAEIEGNDKIIEVLRNVVADPSSDVNKRINNFVAAMSGSYTSPAIQSSAPQTKSVASTENTTKKENSTEGVFGVSESGKTTYNGNEVKVRRISSIKDGEITLVLDNGETANARDVEFGNEKEALLYETVVDMDVDKANDLVHAYNVSRSSASSGPQSVSEYLLGFNEAYRYGKHGIPYEALARDGKHSKNLLEVQRQIAYDRGKTDAAKETEKAEKSRTSKRADNGKSKSPRAYKDEVHISEIKSSKTYKSLSNLQKRSIEGLTAFYKALGIEVYFFESPTDEKGNRTGENGYYNPEDNSIHIDIYAGVDGKGAMIFTTGHELSHYIRNNAPAKFKAFADVIFEQLEGKGVSVEELITKKIETLKKNGRITSDMTDDAAYDLAYEEVVADACEAMLADGEVFAKVAELIKAKDRTLWQTIKDFFANLAAKIKSAYAKLEPDSIEGRYVADMLDTAEELKTLWAEALVEASGAHKESVENNGIRYSFRESKSGMANDMLSPYDAELTKFIEQRGDYIVDSFEKLEKVVNLAFDEPDKKATAYFGIINAKTLEKIKNSIPNLPQTSKDILFKNGKDYSIATTFDSIRHIVDDKNLDRSDVVNYLDRLADTIVEFDNVKFNYYIKGKDKLPGLLFKKRFFDGTMVSFDFVSHKKRSIVLQTLYMDRVDYQKKKSAETLLMQNAYSNTSETQVGQTSNKSLPQISDSVNTPDKKIHSDRNPDAISNRALLANALESVVQNDIERNKLNEYKKKISLIESEQAKLARLNGQIKELSFAKGKRDTEAIKKLQLEATQTANRINTYDRQLLNLESTAALKGVLNREKQAAYKKAEREGKEALERYREKAAQDQKEILARASESRKKGIENRHKTEMRHKIKAVVNELNKYLLKGTKDKHVPIELQKAVAEALDTVNMDTVGAEERIAKLQAELRAAKTIEDMQAITKKIEHIQEMGGNLEAKLSRLKIAYDGIINSDDPLIANSHDEVISNTIGKVAEVVGSTPLRDMSLYQLEAVHDMYTMVLTTIRNVNKAFKAAKGEDITTIANGVIDELEAQKKKSPYTTEAKDRLSKFDWNNLKPVYAFERIGSANFSKVFKEVRAAEDVWANDMSEAQAFREEQFKKYKYDSWDFGERYSFTSTSGMRFELSLDQILSLYAFSKREQAADHLKHGGFVFDGLTEVKSKNKAGVTVTYKLKDATAYNLSEETLGEIISKLTPDQRAFADAMQDYLSTVMGEKGNEVSLALYDVKLFKEKHYFPLKSAPQYLAKAKERAQGDVKIKNSGFTKETTPKAKNPIVLSSFMDVWAGHVNDMSMYHSFTLPLEDFYRVYNYHSVADEQVEMMSVGASLENAHGQAAVKYVDQLLKDINGGARSDPRESLSKALMSKFKKAAVILSLSVVVQQPSAIVRAQALVDSKYFVGKRATKGKHKEVWAEVKKYAPVAIIKEMGYFDTGMGKSSVEWLKGEKTFMDKADDVLSKAPAFADEVTWCSIWNAVKRETLHTHKDLPANSEAFLKVVGERFTEVIVKTQVYDSTLARSANMRSKSAWMNMLTAFMAEPTTSINMLQDGFRKGKRGKYTLRVLGAVYGSVILNSALVSIVYAMRDDDEDETFIEKYLSRFTTELIDGVNPLTNIPFAKDIWSVLQGFDVERADMTLITDLVDSLQQFVAIISKDTSNMDEDEIDERNKEINEAILSISENLASLVGVPAKNVRREINGVINFVKTIKEDVTERDTTLGSLGDAVSEDVKDSIAVWGWFPDESKADKLYDAIINGDTAYVDRLKSSYKDDKAYQSAIRKALRENDPRIKEAAEAKYDEDIAEYTAIINKIIAEGNFEQKDIVAAINAEVSELKGPSETTTSDKEIGIYKVDDYYITALNGDTKTASAVRNELIKEKLAEGYLQVEAEAMVASSFSAKVKEVYMGGDLTRGKAKTLLISYGGKNDNEAETLLKECDFELKHDIPWGDRVRAYRLGKLTKSTLISAVMDIEGKSREDAELYIKFLDLEKANPTADITASDANSYFKYAEPAGIKVDVFLGYKNSTRNIVSDKDKKGNSISGSRKAKVMKVIDSLPITSRQKDALYLTEGWAEGKLHEAPWH